MTEYYIKMKDLAVGYQGNALISDINLKIKKGEIVTLIGPNGAGKSTILKSITRQLKLIGGEVYIDSEEIRKLSYKEMAVKAAVMLTERMKPELMTCHDIVATGRYPYTGRLGILSGEDERKVDEALEAVHAQELGIRNFQEISDGQRQRVLLARAICQEPEVMILDEPTSSLDDDEVEKLFVLMRRLRDEGVGIIFVTHFLEQVYAVCDRITVLRNGELVGEYETKDLPRVMLVAKMMGKDFDDLADIKGEHKDKKKAKPEPVIEAKGISHKGTIKPFDLTINKGEVIGLTGLLGSGRSELVRAIYGADKAETGTLKVKGKEAKINSPLDAMKLGMAYLPEDRKAEGIIADLSVRENIIIALQAKRGMFHPLSKKEMEEAADKYIKLLQIKTASRETPIKSLSGGNQQKVILGRWLLTNPDYLILDEPTRGIDIGTKTEIQKLVLDLADQGMAVTFISSEVEEMLRTCSRMAVLRDGQKVGELEENELSQSGVMKAIAGGDDK